MKSYDSMTLADYSEAWMKENGHTVPPRDSKEWKELYMSWIDYAFDYNKQRNRAFGREE